MKKEKNRVTMLMGAGAVLDFNLPQVITKPSTENITDAVCECIRYDGLCISVINEIRYRLDKLFSDKQFHKINFEDLLHVLEQLNAYKFCWDDSETPNRDIPPFAPFTKCNVGSSLNDLNEIMRRYIRIIMGIVNEYNEYYINNQEKEEWYGRLFADRNRRWDIFNLNYDTTVEQCLGDYEDGYEELQDAGCCKFNPAKLFKNKNNLSTINHLHGCIQYGYKNLPNKDNTLTTIHDLYKYPSYTAAEKQYFQSNPKNQAGESYVGGPIITGLHKTEKITCYPYSFYHGNLIQSILRNNALVIVGYSFGDVYINDIIRSLRQIHKKKARVVLIDYWNLTKECQGKCGFDYFIERCDRRAMTDFMGKICNDKCFSNKTFNGNITNNPLRSKNGCLLLFVKGAKEAAGHSEEILNYIDS